MTEVDNNDAAFRKELDARNARLLSLGVPIFNSVYVLWTIWDQLLAPDYWQEFLGIRIATAVINLLWLVLLRREGGQRHVSSYFWGWFFVFGIAVAPMLATLDDNFTAYVLGLCIVFLGAGAVPYWSLAWVGSCMLSVSAVVITAIAVFSQHETTEKLFIASFATGTVIVIAGFVAHTKFQLSRQEHEARAALEREQLVTESLREADRERAADLSRALDRAEQVDRLKSRFFANVSHELRTPLTLILAPVEDLLGKPVSTEQRESLQVIYRNAGRLLRLIDELLDLSRLDAGGLRLSLGQVDLVALATAQVEDSTPAAHSRKQRIELVVESTPTEVYGDAHRLGLVLTNLVGNALKYTPQGGHIELRVSDEAGWVQLVVADNGPGIAADELAHVFDRFYQARHRDGRLVGGVGIGLSLARELTALHQGELTVASEEGQGTRFTLRLRKGQGHFNEDIVERRQEFRPLPEGGGRRTEDAFLDDVSITPAPPTPIPSAVTANAILFQAGRRPKILVVEDRTDLRRFICQLFEQHYDVLEAEDGEQGLDAVVRERPDLVVSDIMMPGRSGTELCRIMKQDEQLRSIPVILLTARVGSEATLEAYAHGADDFVSKPFHPRVLIARVRAQLQLRALNLQLVGQEKLAAVGVLAAGVAHEIRNPINAIRNAAGVLAEPGGLVESRRDRLLGIVADGAERIFTIVSALDQHARPADGGGTGEYDARAGIEATLVLLSHRLSRIEVVRSFESEATALAPTGGVNQILLNLIDNAIRSGAETLYLGVRDTPDNIVISIADDGPGVPAKNLARIFDPFFTTREPGQGTGLGLYLSRNIAIDAGGELSCGKRAGGGAEFTLTLPLWNPHDPAHSLR